MSSNQGLLSRLVDRALGRTSHGPADAKPVDPSFTDPAGRRQPEEEPSGPDPAMMEELAAKVLLAWLRNRHQLLFPFALDLRRLDGAQTELLLHAMIAAAQADGTFDARERERIAGALRHAVPDEDPARLARALDAPRPLNDVLHEVRDVEDGALVYAASLLAIDQRNPVNRHYLRYLAARLQLPEELVASLELRFRSTG
jgi:uncharacterized membrane protein YebE (DUF533 family)